MWNFKNEYLGLFLSGLTQVMFVAMNTYLVSHKHYVASYATSFLLSFIWTFNVKKVAFGDWKMRVAYAGGAACGTLIGMSLVAIIYQ